MIITITFILSALVALNFLLLIFSCNKNSKSKNIPVKTSLSKVQKTKAVEKQIPATQLAATGS